MSRQRKLIFVSIALAALCVTSMVMWSSLAAVATAPTHGASCRGPARAMTRLEMLFGTARPNGSLISDTEWTSFVDAEVTPRFPAGLTMLRGPGQWRGQDGVLVREQSYIVVIWHDPTSRTDTDVEAIQSAYKLRFDQESVMRVESISCVSF
jgi:Protein of unknown function (DUF3574)